MMLRSRLLENVIEVVLELTKAIDSISHEKLINKRSILNMKRTERKWLSSHLKNKPLCVEIHHT